MNLDVLNEVAVKMVRPGQGLLAADESTGTIKKRFDSIGVESTFENRRDWREMLFRAEKAMKEHVSGVILFEETLKQEAKDGTPLVKLIADNDAIPGIKVDRGAKPMAGRADETVTEGLDGLRERLKDYYDHGARFAKWRAVIRITDTKPSWGAVKANSHALARYAALCQEANIVPIVEPEVLMDGTHTIARCEDVTQHVLKNVFSDLYEQNIQLEGMVLKPNMVVSGQDCPQQASQEEVAERTLKVLKACVPTSVPGIAFLSGGQSDIDATAHLNIMNKMGGFPWKLTYSYGRALQASTLEAWKGNPDNYERAQKEFYHRAHMNGLASRGEWAPSLETV